MPTATTATATDAPSGVIEEDGAGQPSNQERRSSGPADGVQFIVRSFDRDCGFAELLVIVAFERLRRGSIRIPRFLEICVVGQERGPSHHKTPASSAMRSLARTLRVGSFSHAWRATSAIGASPGKRLRASTSSDRQPRLRPHSSPSTYRTRRMLPHLQTWLVPYAVRLGSANPSNPRCSRIPGTSHLRRLTDMGSYVHVSEGLWMPAKERGGGAWQRGGRPQASRE